MVPVSATTCNNVVVQAELDMSSKLQKTNYNRHLHVLKRTV